MLKSFVNLAAAAALCWPPRPATARRSTTVDPNQRRQLADDADEPRPRPTTAGPAGDDEWTPVERAGAADVDARRNATPAPPPPADASRPATEQSSTVPREDVFNAAEGVFGRGARGLAELLENILRDQGEPIAYIAGQEAGGAFMFGVRYGSGVMHHQIEGERTRLLDRPVDRLRRRRRRQQGVRAGLQSPRQPAACSAAIRAARATPISSAASRPPICAAATWC